LPKVFHVIASAAKQSRYNNPENNSADNPAKRLDCHAALAMTRYKENGIKSENFWQSLY